MSEEERREYLNEQRHNEVINALKQQNKDLHALSQHIGRQNWWTDFASDIVANFTTDDLIWLGSRLLRKV